MLASTTRPNLPECGQLGSPAASAVKLTRKSSGVTWADLPANGGASPRWAISHPTYVDCFKKAMDTCLHLIEYLC